MRFSSFYCRFQVRRHNFFASYLSNLSDLLLITEYSCSFFCWFLADSCSNIKSVGKPVTHNTRFKTQGAWMKDPLGIMGAETIFVMKSYHSGNELEEFANMDMFKVALARKKYTLPFNYDGTGAVVYGPYLYYNR